MAAPPSLSKKLSRSVSTAKIAREPGLTLRGDIFGGGDCPIEQRLCLKTLVLGEMSLALREAGEPLLESPLGKDRQTETAPGHPDPSVCRTALPRSSVMRNALKTTSKNPAQAPDRRVEAPGKLLGANLRPFVCYDVPERHSGHWTAAAPDDATSPTMMRGPDGHLK